MTQPLTTPNFPDKIAYLPTALRAAGISMGAAFAVNHGKNVPLLKEAIGGYHKAMHGFFKTLGGEKLKDESMLNAGFSTSIDFVAAGIACLVLGRLGIGTEAGKQVGKIADNIKHLFSSRGVAD